MLLSILTLIHGQRILVPGDHSTIQAGIDAAGTGDTVLVAEGTYTENINFKGKAITVASMYVLDQDPGHIEATVIDGSQPVHPDTGSVVLMISGEDTTSVLKGFTITGGTGTVYDIGDTLDRRAGGGVLILGSGGKVEENIIEGNAIEDTLTHANLGGGICAIIFNNHTAILRNNSIRNNQVVGNITYGGGITAVSGRLICDGNRIEGNAIHSKNFASGGGMYHDYIEDHEGSIDEIIICNNIITRDTMFSETSYGGGGGLSFGPGAEVKSIQVYNNLICNNSARAGGGLILWRGSGSFYNNTIVDNIHEEPGSAECNIALVYTDQRTVLYNNIIAHSIPDKPDFKCWFTAEQEIHLFHNLISNPEALSESTTAYANVKGSPDFIAGTYELAEGSPGIGWGVMSAELDGVEFTAPEYDINGNVRPNPVDVRSDVGAYESAFEAYVYIPDAKFLAALIEAGVDTDEDGKISYEEAEAVDTLLIPEKEITDLTGINAFTNITYLDVKGNILPIFDASLITGLKKLICEDNPLGEIDLGCYPELHYLNVNHTGLSELDLSENTVLDTIRCERNYLTELDLSHNPELIFCWCRVNMIDKLDFSKNPKLKKIYAYDAGARIVYTKFNPLLEEIEACNNNLITQDVTHNPLLRVINISSNPVNSNIDLSNNPNLEWLFMYKCNQTEIDLSNNPLITDLFLGHNELTELNVSNLTDLANFYCDSNLLTSLDLTNNTNIKDIDVSNMPSLAEICIFDGFWEMDPAISIDDESSPNILYTTECGTCIPPVLTVEDEFYQPATIEVTSNMDGVVFLTETMQSDLASVRENCCDTCAVEAGTPVELCPGSWENGDYYVYAINQWGRMNDGVKIEVLGVGLDESTSCPFKVYPNPAGEMLSVATTVPGSYGVSLKTLSGQELYQSTMQGDRMQIDLSAIPQGIYFIHVTSETASHVVKIVKL